MAKKRDGTDSEKEIRGDKIQSQDLHLQPVDWTV